MVKSPLAHFIAFYLLTYFFLLGNEIPSVSMTEVNMLQHGDSITIFCNITFAQDYRTGLKRISWFKNGVVQQSVRNPDPDNPEDSLAPLVIKMPRPEMEEITVVSLSLSSLRSADAFPVVASLPPKNSFSHRHRRNFVS